MYKNDNSVKCWTIEKSKIKRLKNVDLLAELPFYDQLNIIKIDQAFKGYARLCKVEIVDRKIWLYN